MTGDGYISKEELAQMLADAARKGAREAIIELFIDPSNAADTPGKVRKDLADLRDLLDGWRSARSGILSGVWKAIGTLVVGAVLAFMAWWSANGFKH